MKLFVSFDGDRIGRMVGRMSLADDEAGIKRVDQAINSGNDIWRSWALTTLGDVIEIGGDEGRLKIPADKLSELEEIRRQYQAAVGSTVSVGVGVRLSEADRALMAAKLRGGDKIVLYTPEVEHELQQSQQKTEAQKLGDEYLDKSEFRRTLLKADPPEPETTAKENKGNAGGGFSGRHEAGVGGEPQAPAQEASEHSQGEAAQASLNERSSPETTHSGADFEQALHDHAQEQDKKDQDDQDQELDPQQVKAQVVQILQQVRQQAPAMGQLQAQAPDLYAAMQGVVQSLILTARALVDQSPDSQKVVEQKSQETQKAEKAYKLEGDALIEVDPKTGKSLGKGPVNKGELEKVAPPGFSEETMHKLKSKYGEESAFKIAWAAHSKHAAKKAELPMPKPPPKHPHLNLPVGSTMDGKVKVRHDDGHSSWISVRSGQVLSNDGHPISSRNPTGK